MSTFYDEIRESIGTYLDEIGATFQREEHIGDEEVCYFSARGRIIAITYSPHDNMTCRVSPPRPQPPFDHHAWETLWSAMGLTKDNHTIEGFDAYVSLFPDDSYEYMIFMGKCLAKYFTSTEMTAG
jgi:hypothetical protein